MPISATGKHERGFTLIELMVVIAIIALMTSAVVLAMPDGDGQTQIQAERFAARVALARDTAITKVQPVALIVDQAGYHFEQRQSGAWQALEASQFWTDGVAAQGGERVVFDPVGLAEQDVAVTLTKGDERSRIMIAAGGGVRVAP